MRIIAGSLRSRRLRAPKGGDTRPTSDRAREALFSRLGPVDGVQVADLFAGSGALGLEALSRGAASCTFVESGRAPLTALRANLADLAPAGAVVMPARLPAALVRLDTPFDLLFLDPPYAAVDLLTTTLERLVASPLLTDRTLLVVEHAARTPPTVPPELRVDESRTVGETAFTFLRPIAGRHGIR